MARRTIPLAIVFTGGLVMILDYFLGRPGWLKELREVFSAWARLGFTAAVLVGIINLILVNLRKMVRRQRGWFYNATLLVTLVVTAGAGIVQGGWPPGVTGHSWDRGVPFWVFNQIYNPCLATMFGLLAFFIASAAFRAFRARNVEAVLLLASAIVVMLGNIPLFEGSTGALFAESKNFIMAGPMTGAQRAILIAAATGAIFFSLKVLTGVDRSYFGGGD